jgi:site-specific recombinase
MTYRPGSLFALLKKDDGARSRLDEICEFAPTDGPEEKGVAWFVEVVAWLRPRPGQRGAARLRFLQQQLEQHPTWRARFARALARLVESAQIDTLLAYGGIPQHFHFGGAVSDWFLARLLPDACRTRDAAQILHLAFAEGDVPWLGDTELLAFLASLLDPEAIAALRKDLGEALVELSHQIVAQAHAPIIRSLDAAGRSPYRGLHDAVLTLCERPDDAAFEAIRGRIGQCLLLLRAHRAALAERGADINTTFQLTRMRQQLERLLLLARLRHHPTAATLADAAQELVGGAIRNHAGARLFARSADLLIQNLVDTAATVGRAYLDREQSSWWAAFKAGAGGGLLMALATVLKYLLMRLDLSALYEGLVFSINYSAAFCAAYLLHFTIATKLPAHTAAALARSVQGREGHRARLDAFLVVWRSTVRLQVSGLVGNIVVAGPLAFAVDAGAMGAFHHHVLTLHEADHVLASNAILGPSILFAALTGMFLWVSSLIGAWGENWTRVTHLSDRLATNLHAMKRLGAERARGYADAVVKRTGGLLGNVALGFMLGGIPAAFTIAHLPVQIRHVTVSTSSVALAVAAGGAGGSEIALAVAGVVMIGFVNVMVSFAFALWLALRATRGIRATGSASALVRIGLMRWTAKRRTPRPSPAAPALTS